MPRPTSIVQPAAPLLLLACLGLSLLNVAARSSTAVPPGQSCGPTSAALPQGATLAGARGRHRLVLVTRADDRTVSGGLVLVASPPGREALGPVSTPLLGATDIDLRTVGAHRIGNPASTDPDAPGVLVLEFDRDGARQILLRLGSDANRLDDLLYDGGHTVLQVREISTDGFAGTWESRARSTFAEGHFCATRL